MVKVGRSTFVWLEFNEDGAATPADVDALKSTLAEPGLTDLVVMSHGWKNTRDDAFKLYTDLWKNTAAGSDQESRTLLVGVVWPAKKYPTDFDQKSVGDQIAQSGGQVGGARELSKAELDQVYNDFSELFGQCASAVIEKAREVVQNDINENTAVALLTAAQQLLGTTVGAFDGELAQAAKSINKAAIDADRAQGILAAMSPPPSFNETQPGGAQGIGDAITSVFQGTGAAVARFLNQLTYFEMKKRSGTVGVSLAKNVLSQLNPPTVVRLHLVGHSFGGRLVTAAANEWKDSVKLKLTSMTLLQAAYSHNGLAAMVDGTPGAFRNVIGKVSGPTIITHTQNDSACTVAYPLASRLARDIANALGGADDKFGAMGANGPQLLAKDAVILHDGIPPKLTLGKINSILADSFISEHNDVANPKCGKLFGLVFGS